MSTISAIDADRHLAGSIGLIATHRDGSFRRRPLAAAFCRRDGI